jgi:hypothetical protein
MLRLTPKKIEKIMIKKYDIDNVQQKRTKFYSYLTKANKDIVKVTVAICKYKNKYLIKQVALHTLDSKKAYARDMNFYYTCGYTVDWTDEKNGFEIDYLTLPWNYIDYKYYDPYAPLVNIDFLDKYPEFKYSCYKDFKGDNILKFLRLYKEYPELEIIMKLKLYNLWDSVTILKQLRKDKGFIKHLRKYEVEIKCHYPYVSSIINSYKTGKPLRDVELLERFKKELNDTDFGTLRTMFYPELEKFMKYTKEQNIQPRLYNDYLQACNYLGLDMTINKNRYPKDFKRWHDIRINEMHSKQAELDKAKKAKFYADFLSVANKYIALENNKKDTYITIIAKSPQELKIEGDTLHHCVGRMGYDKKMLNEQSLIFFVRDKNTPDKPLVTIEYSLLTKRILQCYADHNSKPNEQISHYINKQWLPYANRQINKIKGARLCA